MENTTETENATEEENVSTKSPSKSRDLSTSPKSGILAKFFPCWSICFSQDEPPVISDFNTEELSISSSPLKPSIDSNT